MTLPLVPLTIDQAYQGLAEALGIGCGIGLVLVLISLLTDKN